MDKQLHIAIDGGGTKTIGILFDGEGRIIKSSKSQTASNIALIGHQGLAISVADNVMEIISNLCGGTESKLASVTFTIPGFEACLPIMAKRLPENLKIIMSSDNESAYLGAFCSETGICVSAGTGAFAGYPDKKYPEGFLFVGGWGALYEDVGGGYYAGVCALKRLMDDIDRNDFCMLSVKLLEHFNLKKDLSAKRELIKKLYITKEIDRKAIAELSFLLKSCAENCSEEAIGVFETCAYRLAELAYRTYCIEKLDKQCPVALVGGLKKVGDYLIEPFKRRLVEFSDNLIYKQPRFDNYIGSVLFALKQTGADISVDGAVVKNLEMTKKTV